MEARRVLRVRQGVENAGIVMNRYAMRRTGSSRGRRAVGALCGAILVAAHAVAGPSPLAAQTVPSTGAIRGTVIDAQTQAPLDGATVTLEARGGGLFPQPRGGGVLSSTLTTTTDAAGEYLFAGLTPGEYRLHVQRLGYASASADVTFRGSADARVSLGLRIQAVALEPVSVDGVGAGPAVLPNPSTRHGERIDSMRIAAERRRQEAHLSSDVRVMTRADVAQGITLGETDLFRALQRLPGVSARDEYSAELLTRGARFDQTRLYFDGLPLFNPLHAGGMFAGVNADAVGAVLLHPGLQPTRLGGGAAGAVEIQSRRGGVDAPFTTVGELSLASARLTHDFRTRDAQTAGLVSVRRSYLDWLTRGVQKFAGGDDIHVPYHFSDVVLRGDRAVGESRAIEASLLLEYDRISGDVPDVLHRTDARWGGGAGRVTLATDLFGHPTRHTLGVSGHASRIRPRAPGRADEIYSAPGSPPSDNTLTHLTLNGEVQGRGGWSAGYEIVSQQQSYDGERPSAVGRVQPGDRLTLSGTSRYVAAWGDHRVRLGEAITVQAGARIEAGGAGSGDSPVRLAPRLAARWQAGRQLTVSAAAGRSYQYVQALGGAGIRPLAGFDGEYLWLTAGGAVPVLRADVVSLGAEQWLGQQWLAGVTLHGRRSDGGVLMHPIPGVHGIGTTSLGNPAPGEPLFTTGRNEAHGVELSLKRVAGRATAAFGYAYGVSEIEAAGLRFPSSADQRHVFDATAQLRVTRGWRLGAAYSAATGAPYTRAFTGTLYCYADRPCEWAEEPWIDAPNALRAPARQSLDVLTEWSRRFGGWEGSFFVQVRNVLNRSNQGRYVGYYSGYCPHFGTCGPGGNAEWVVAPYDEFLPGAPILPVLGFRFSF
jgi:hypothetical protein